MEEATRRFPEIKAQLGEEEQAKCPRCESRNTKFCYYNNYNLSQPRHFCKNCRRYWTKGGALRNIPVGGGTRKNNSKRPKRPNPEAAASPTGVIDPDRRELDTGGSFSSVMGGGQFGNFLDGSGLKMDGFGGEGSGNSNNNSGLDLEGSGNSNKEGHLESGNWGSGTGWPDLAICTPGSTFQ